jgi:starch synthase
VFFTDVQFVLLGTGEAKYEEFFNKLQAKYPEKLSVNLKFDINLAQKIYAGSDMFMMPSRYEPCGLGQMYSLRYGTVPIVRYTGGLSDSVKEFDEEKIEGNGFGFKEYNSAYLLKAICKAIYCARDPEMWEKIVRNAMNSDFSWDRSANEYKKLYAKALKKKV